jgi:hypothetical protein
MSETTNRSGGCSCREIRFGFRGDVEHQLACSCRTCQYASGGGPNYSVIVSGENFRVTRGTPREFKTLSEAGHVLIRYFCGNCGTHIYATSERSPDSRSIKVGALDDSSRFRPRVHFWTSEAPRWHKKHWFTMRFSKNPPQRGSQAAPEREDIDPLNSDHPI